MMKPETRMAQEEAKASRKVNRGVDLDLGVEAHREVPTQHTMHHHNKIKVMGTSIVGKGRLVLEMPHDLQPKVTSRTKGSKVDLVRGGSSRTRGGLEQLF